MARFIELQPDDWHLVDDIGRIRLMAENGVWVLRVYDSNGSRFEERAYDTRAAGQAALRRLLSELEGTEAT